MSERLDSILGRLAPRFPLLDLQVLLAHVLGRPRAWVLAHPDETLTQEQEAAFQAALARLEAGVPLPYILGHWEFYGLDFHLTPDVLIPRPETELLVETALHWIQAAPDGQSIQALDVGVGSGCIAIALAVHAPHIQLTAADLSPAALEVARLNAARHHVAERIKFYQADLLNFPAARFDLIVANLPYIPTSALKKLEIYGKEPTLALDGGPDGLALIRRLLTSAAAFIAPHGCLLLEIEASQGKSASLIAQQCFAHSKISLLTDLSGRERLLQIQG